MGKYILFLFFLSLISISCDNSTSPILSGNMTGFVSLYKEDYSLYKNFSGVRVQVEGTSFYGITDSSGKYTIKNVPAGIYNIVFSKDGFGTYKFISREFPGGGEAYYGHVTLYELPSFTLNSLNVSRDSTHYDIYFTFTGTVSDTQNYWRSILFFFGYANVSSQPADYISSYTTSIYPDSLTFSMDLMKQFLLNDGFKEGDTIHILAYPTTGYSSYPDPKTGKFFYGNLGNDPVSASFVLH